MQVIVIGRGHSGTRVIAQTLAISGFLMGQLNESYDLVPGRYMYEAVKLFGSLVEFSDTYEWEFSEAVKTPVPVAYNGFLHQYLRYLPINESHYDIAWKLPETTLALPWLVDRFPDAYYIHWIRDGRDNILGQHGTDMLDHWNIPAPYHEGGRLYNAAISWRYHEALIEATPKPVNWVSIRYEDFILDQENILMQLTAYLKRELVSVPVDNSPIGRWQRTEEDLRGPTEIMQPYLEKHGYIEVYV